MWCWLILRGGKPSELERKSDEIKALVDLRSSEAEYKSGEVTEPTSLGDLSSSVARAYTIKFAPTFVKNYKKNPVVIQNKAEKTDPLLSY